MNIGVFGSCLSADPAWFLKNHYAATEKLRIFHNRSDQFIKYYIKSATFPRLLASAEDLKPIAEKEEAARSIIFNQLPESIGCEGPLAQMADKAKKLDERIADANLDLILMDNFVDVVARLICSPDRPDEKLFYPLHFRKEAEKSNHLLDEILEPKASASNFLEIIRYFKKTSPKAKIVFTCWPLATSKKSEIRYNRIANFFIHFSTLVEVYDLAVIPPLVLEDKFTNGEEDWYHLSKEIYKSIAGVAYLYYSAGIKPDLGSYQLPYYSGHI